MNEDMKAGALIALQGVKEEISTIVAELCRKGFEKPKGFSVLEGFIEDSISQLNGSLEDNRKGMGTPAGVPKPCDGTSQGMVKWKDS